MVAKSPHIRDIDAYVRDVLSDKRLACKWEKAACERFLSDKRRSRTKACDYTFDTRRATRAIKFIETLPHVKGKWAKLVGSERSAKLEGWQKFIVGNIFGWVHKRTGLRRFRTAFVLVPRKNGKSFIAAGIGHYMFSADGEYGAEVYCGATTEKQAWEVFGPAKKMAERTPAYRRHFGIQVNAKHLERPRDGSKFLPVIGDPGDGSSPSCAIVDEYHEHKDDSLYDTMVTGMGAREQPLALVISTAGTDISGPCYGMQKDVEKVLSGIHENDQLFGIIYGIDQGDDWTTEEALIKANPNYGISVGEDFLRNQQRDALQSPRKQNTFKRKHCNIWVNAKDAWMNMEWWNKLGDSSLKREDFAGCEAYKALDLSSKTDITANVDIFAKDLETAGEGGSTKTERHFYLFGKFYLPEDSAQEEGKDHYQEWVNSGDLITTDGNIIDYQKIEDDVVADCTESDIKNIGYDPWGATQLAQRLQDEHGLPVLEIPQNVKHLSEPMKELEAMVKAGRLHHDNNPVMNWMMSNVVAKEDANENIYPRKEVPENKIDGPVAAIMCMLLAMDESREESHESIYETMSF